MKKVYRTFIKKVAKIRSNKIMVVDGRGRVQGELAKNLPEWKTKWGDTIRWQADFRVKRF